MKRRSHVDYFRDILEAAVQAQEFVKGQDFESFSRNQEKIYAVTRALEIIGEADRSVPSDIQAQYPEVPWHEMIAMRNIVAHQYFGVELRVLWRTVFEDLPPLQSEVSQILESLDRAEGTLR